MKNRKALTLAAALLATAAVPGLAQSGDPVGYVDRKRGAAGEEVWIERGDRKLRAAAGTPLHVGDVVRVRGNGNFAYLLLAGHKGVARVRPRESFIVPTPPEESWFGRFGDLLAGVGGALGITDRVTTGNTFTRGVGEVDRSEPLTAEILSRVPALESSNLYAARELDALALRWCGDAADVRASSDGVMITKVEKQNIGFGTVEIANYVDIDANTGEDFPADRLEILPLVGADNEIAYAIKWVPLAEVPRPASLVDISDPSAADKVEWANWLIEDEDGVLGNQYNLIAFSLLAEARDDIWLAGYLLERASYCPSSGDASEG